MLEELSANFGSFYGEGTRFVRPRPYYYRVCHHIWSEYFARKRGEQGTAVCADLEAADRTWRTLDPDTQEFLLFLHRYDAVWCNPRDSARVLAVKRRSTMTEIMRRFNAANKALAIARGLVDANTGDEGEEG